MILKGGLYTLKFSVAIFFNTNFFKSNAQIHALILIISTSKACIRVSIRQLSVTSTPITKHFQEETNRLLCQYNLSRPALIITTRTNIDPIMKTITLKIKNRLLEMISRDTKKEGTILNSKIKKKGKIKGVT